jgi:SAM-dependent methyltransferase
MSRLAVYRKRLATFEAKVTAALWAIMFDRRRRRLARRYLRGNGLEIGALHRPLRVPSGAHVRYVDRIDLAALRDQYPELAGQELVEVDVIDDGERLQSQPDASADFIIANHFIEHAEDPLGTLASHMRVLRPGGILYMAVPDRRQTFDAARPPTSLEHIIRDHTEGPSGSRRAHQEEWARLVEKVSSSEVTARVCTLEERDYSIHFHVWTPWEFRALLDYARDEARLPLAVETLQENDQEFIVILRRT